MIKLKDVSKYYNSNGIVTVALEHINLEFNRGDIVAITGESGSGKSTLLNIICGNDNYDDGEIYFYQDETSYFDVNDLDNFRNKYVGFIYQNYNIIENYTVLQNVMLPLLLKGLSKKEAKTKALELIKQVGLENRSKHKGTKLSGGEKQRVVIARALAKDPDILACDEPTGNLDSKTSQEIINLIKEVAKDKLVLIVTHNYEEVKDIATRKVTLVDGHIIEDKILKEVSEDKEEKLELEVPKIPFKDTLYFVKNNILGTPKKTIFAVIVMFVLSFFILSMFQAVNYSFCTSSRYNYNKIAYYGDDYYFVKKRDNSKIDSDYLLSLSPDFNVYTTSEYLSLSNSNFNNLRYLTFIPDYIRLIGSLPESANEVLILVPNTEDLRNFYTYIDRNFSFKYASNLVISGVATVRNLSNISFYTITDYSEEIYKDNFVDYISCIYDNKEITVFNKTTSSSGKPFTLVLPPLYNDKKDVQILFNDIYNMTDEIEYDIVYDLENTYFEPYLEVCLPEDFNYTCYEASIYTDNISIINNLRNNGYEVYKVIDYAKIGLDVYMTLALLTLLCIIPVFFIYLITYLIYKAIYTSKFKNYTIMRILGITKKNMSLQIIIETFFVSFISSVLAFIFSIVLGYGFNIMIYYEINLYIILVYFILMILFSICLSLKVHNKLFKTTTAKMLKGSE